MNSQTCSATALVCAIGDFLRLAETSSHFVNGHSDGDLVSCDESIDDFPTLLAFLQVCQEPFRKRFEIVVGNPRGDTALLGVASDPASIVGKCFRLHDLRKAQCAGVSRHSDVEIAGRRTEDFQPKRFLIEIGQVDRTGLPYDRPGINFPRH